MLAQRNDSQTGQILRDPDFALICFVSFGIFLSRAGARMTIIPLMAYSRLGMSESQLGLTYTGIAALNLLAVPVAGVVADRYGRKAAIVPSTALAGLAHVLIGMSPDLALFLLSAGLIGIATGIGGPAPAAYAADIAPPNARGMALGLFRTFSDLALVTGPVVLGWVAEMTDYAWALYVDAAVVLVGSLAFGAFAKETLRRESLAKKPDLVGPA